MKTQLLKLIPCSAIALFLSYTGLRACTPAAPGLVSWWQAESNANDSVSGNNGTTHSITYTNGEVGTAFVFNGSSSSYIKIPASSNLDVGQGNGFTIELWCNPTTTNFTSNPMTLLEWNNNSGASTGIGCHLEFYNGGYIIGDIVDPATGNDHFVESAGGNVTPNVWQHVAMTYDKTTGTLTLYRNGSVVASGNVGSVTPSTAFDLYFGIRSAGIFAPIPYQGSLDEISLYSRVLSACEIQAIYNAQSAGKCPPASPSCTPAPSGLVSWWQAESNANDSVSGNNGTTHSITYTNGEVGTAFVFNGSGSNYIKVPANCTLDVGQANGFTIELWCNPTTTNFASNPMTLLEWNDNSGNLTGIGCHLEFYNGGFILGDIVDPATGDDHYVESAGGNVTPNVWQHVAMTYDKTTGTLTLYRNGVVVASGNVGSVTPSTAFDLYFGIRSAGVFAPIPYQGSLDEISLYSRVLSACEIQAIYDAQRAGKCPPASPSCTPAPSGLVSWWQAESNANDSISGNNGTTHSVTYTNGEVGTAFVFNGSSSSYVKIPASSNLDVGQADGFTVELWCNPATTNASGVGVMTLLEWNNNSGNLTGIGCHLEFYNGGYIIGDIVDPATGNDHFVESAGGNVTPNVWQHVAMTYDKTTGTLTLYRNGSVVASGNVGSVTPSTAFDLYFGIRSAGVFASIPYQGSLDEISLYSRVLSACEIQAIYNAGSAGKCPP